MLYHKVECPHCGNEINVNDSREVHKCRWCRRLVSAKFERTNGKKFKCEVEAMDFPEEQKRNQVKSFSKWRDEDIYGHV